MTDILEMNMYRAKPFAILSGGNSVRIYDITTGAIAAVPIPTIKRAISIKIKVGAIAVRMLPIVKTAIPISKVLLRPVRSPNLPRIGAKAAVDIAIARAVHVVLLYGRFNSSIKAGLNKVVNPPTNPTRKAARP